MVSEDRNVGAMINANARSLTFKAVRNMLTIFVLLVFLGFPGTLSKMIGSSVAKLLMNASFGLQFLLIILASGEDVMSIKLININYAYWLIYLFLAYIILNSMAVSIDKKMVLTSVVHLSLTALFALWLIDQFDIEEMLEMFYAALVIFVSIMLVGTVIFPRIVFYTYHGSRTFCGLFSTKNECGTVLCMGVILQAVLLATRMKSKKRIGPLFLGLLGAQFILLLLTKNMGSIMVSFVALGYIFYYSMQKKKKRLPIFLLFIVGSIGFLFFALTVLQALSPFLESLGKDATITGRVPLWEQAIYVMQNNKTLTGYGYLMFWRTPSIVSVFHSRFEKNTWAATLSASMHNLIIEFWCDNGLLGVAIFFLMCLVADRGVKHLNETQYMFSSAFIVMYTVTNLTERGMMADSLFTLVFFVVVGMLFQAKQNGKLKRMKKARVYQADPVPIVEEKERESGPDWFSFQKKFSNEAVTISAERLSQLQTETDESEGEEEETELDAMFKSLYDDDKL